MIALDTNVLVRYIMQDDVDQAARASKLVESLSADRPALIPLVVVVELAWVLARSYKLKRPQIAQAIEGLMSSRELIIAQSATVWSALRAYRKGKGDFSDCLIARCATAEGCSQVMTFDRAAARHSGMQLIN
jgi:predicted nucleic-acid-binding protein